MAGLKLEGRQHENHSNWQFTYNKSYIFVTSSRKKSNVLQPQAELLQHAALIGEVDVVITIKPLPVAPEATDARHRARCVLLQAVVRQVVDRRLALQLRPVAPTLAAARELVERQPACAQ